MRLMLSEEIYELFDEIQPYYDENHHLRDDTPEEIRQKEKKMHELHDKQRKEAMRIELGFDIE